MNLINGIGKNRQIYASTGTFLASDCMQGQLSGDTETPSEPRLKFNLTVCCCVYWVAVVAVGPAHTALPSAALSGFQRIYIKAQLLYLDARRGALLSSDDMSRRKINCFTWISQPSTKPPRCVCILAAVLLNSLAMLFGLMQPQTFSVRDQVQRLS